MSTTLTWDALRRVALELEIKIEVQEGHIFFYQYGSDQYGKFEENLAGCQQASGWLSAVRQAIAVRDQLRSRELPGRRRMHMRFLWRR